MPSLHAAAMAPVRHHSRWRFSGGLDGECAALAHYRACTRQTQRMQALPGQARLRPGRCSHGAAAGAGYMLRWPLRAAPWGGIWGITRPLFDPIFDPIFDPPLTLFDRPYHFLTHHSIYCILMLCLWPLMQPSIPHASKLWIDRPPKGPGWHAAPGVRHHQDRPPPSTAFN